MAPVATGMAQWLVPGRPGVWALRQLPDGRSDDPGRQKAKRGSGAFERSNALHGRHEEYATKTNRNDWVCERETGSQHVDRICRPCLVLPK